MSKCTHIGSPFWIALSNHTESWFSLKCDIYLPKVNLSCYNNNRQMSQFTAKKHRKR